MGTNWTGISSNTATTTGGAVLLVAEFDYNGGAGLDAAKIYLDPTSLTTPNNLIATFPSLTLPQITMVRLFSGGNSSGSSAATSTTFDELTIGQSYTDVVPEPSSLALLGLTSAMMLIRRRGTA